MTCSDSLVALFKMGVIMFLKKSLSVLILMVVTSVASANWAATDGSSAFISINAFTPLTDTFGIFGGSADISTDAPLLTFSGEFLEPASTINWGSSPASSVASDFQVAWKSAGSWYLPFSVGPVLNVADTYQFVFLAGTSFTILYATDITPFEATAPIPVPSAIWMFGAGLVGLLSSVGRKKRISANVVTA
ncbi:MAG: hypothetical protein U1E02_02980 [Hydrogenophaga sp.]|nr:hypothetical protein [Hydrogenophaga sp.]